MTLSPPIAWCYWILSLMNFSVIIKSSLAESFCPATYIYPFYLAFLICSDVNCAIPFLTSPKALLPLNLGPKTGRFGKHVSFTYFYTFFSYSISLTFIYYSIYGRKSFKFAFRSSEVLTIVNDMIGCFNEIFLFSLSLRAVSMILVVMFIN